MRESRKGRPLKSAEMRKRRNNTFRTRDALYDRLKANAYANQRSISEEVEYRLERSFLMDDVVLSIRSEVRETIRGELLWLHDSSGSHPERAYTEHLPTFNLEFPQHSHAGIHPNGDISGTVSLKRVR